MPGQVSRAGPARRAGGVSPLIPRSHQGADAPRSPSRRVFYQAAHILTEFSPKRLVFHQGRGPMRRGLLCLGVLVLVGLGFSFAKVKQPLAKTAAERGRQA